MSEESFKQVFSKFFPSFSSSTGSYAHHVFSCMDNTGSGSVNFEQFLSTLALLTHGSYDERVAWIFRLYDVNKDGSICRGDLEEITASVSNTTQKSSWRIKIYFQIFCIIGDKEDVVVRDLIKERVETVSLKMGLHSQDERISLETWKHVCRQDTQLHQSLMAWSWKVKNKHHCMISIVYVLFQWFRYQHKTLALVLLTETWDCQLMITEHTDLARPGSTDTDCCHQTITLS